MAITYPNMGMGKGYRYIAYFSKKFFLTILTIAIAFSVSKLMTAGTTLTEKD